MNTTKNKQVIRTLYETYRKEYLNELYDTPLQYKQQDASKYNVLNDDNTSIAYFFIYIQIRYQHISDRLQEI